MPINQVDAFAQTSDIQAVNLDEIIPLDVPTPEAADEPVTVDPPGPTTPNENAYMVSPESGIRDR